MGAEIILGAAALAVATGSAIAGTASANHAANKAAETNVSEAEKNRQFQQQMYDKQLADQERQYKMYQSPQAVAQQLRSIGVNPASYFSGGKGMNTQMPQIPGGLPGSQATVQQSQGTGAIVSDAFKNASQGLMNLSTIYKTKKEREKLDADIQLVLAQKYGQDALNNHQAIVNEVDKWKLPEQAKADLMMTLNQAALFSSQKLYQDAATEYQKVLTMIGNKEYDIKSAEAGNILYLLSLQNGLIEQQTETEKTKQKANKATAFEATTAGRLNLSKKETEDALRDIRKSFESAKVREVLAKAGVSEAEFQKQASELLHAKDKEVFWKSHPRIREIMSIWRAACDEVGYPLANILKGLF